MDENRGERGMADRLRGMSGRLQGVTDRLRGAVDSHRDRHARRARELAARLDEVVGGGPATAAEPGGRRGDDDEVGDRVIEIRPWEYRLPRLVVLHAAEARGLVPVGGRSALVERGPWLEPMRFTRVEAPAGGAPHARVDAR